MTNEQIEKEIKKLKRQISCLYPYKVYTALLTQSGTNAPVATVLQNTLGGTVVWTRVSSGDYEGTLSSAFTSNKTLCNISPTFLVTMAFNEGINVICEPSSTSVIHINTGTDDYLNVTWVEVKVYY